MLLTFREMQRQVQAKIQNTTTSVSNANDLLPKIKDWLNDRYARIYRSFFFQEIINSYEVTLTNDEEEYVFDRDVEPNGVMAVFDKTNGYTILQDTIQNHTTYIAPSHDKASNALSDIPRRFRYTGVNTVKNRVGDTGEKVTIVSSAVGDISPNAVRVEGLVGGVRIGEEIELTGTTSAESVNTYDSGQLLTVSCGTTSGASKTVSGKITVTGSDSSTVFAELSPDEYAHKYQWFKVSPKPVATGTTPTWEIWHKRYFRRLDQDTDIPLFDCCIELIQGAFADALREDGLTQEAQVAEQQMLSMVRELQSSRMPRHLSEQFKPFRGHQRTHLSHSYDWVN